MKNRAKNLKEVASALNITVYRASQLRKKINAHYGCPEYMIHGTNGRKYNINAFKLALNNEFK